MYEPSNEGLPSLLVKLGKKQEKVALLLVFFGCLLKQILSILHLISRKKDV